MRKVRGQEHVGSPQVKTRGTREIKVALTSVKERVQHILEERHDGKYYNWKMGVCLAVSALLIL